MKQLLLLPYRFYIIFIWFPTMWFLTVMCALTEILMIAIGCFSPKQLMLPAKIWSRICLWCAFIKLDLRGIENIKEGQSYVFAANHQSMFDIWAIYGWIPTPFAWMMKKEIRKIPFVGLACERLGHIFVDRTNPIAAHKSMEQAKKTLTNGHSIVIFPEGTRTKNGKIGAFKRGAFAIAVDLKMPIIPVTISGSFERKAWNGFNINPGTIIVTYHPAINTAMQDNADIKQIANEVKESVSSALPEKNK